MNRKYLATPYIIWVIGFVFIPLVFILAQAFTGDNGFTLSNLFAIFTPIHRKALLLSLELSAVCTVICVIMAYPLALIFRNTKLDQKSLMILILVLPMWMNFVLRVLALQMILSNNGILNMILTTLGLPALQMINSPAAIVFGMVYDFLPYMIMPIMNSILAIDKDVIEAAKDLGASNFQVFWRIIFPLSLPGMGSGVTMVFVPAMTAFVISDILGGGKIQLLGNIIEQEFTVSMDWGLGSGLSVALMLFILATMLLFGGKMNEDGAGLV